jgi:hypothetical protein
MDMKAGGRLSYLLLSLSLLLAGCRNNDVLENELRHRESLYREALEEQRKAECRIDSLQREVEALRQGPARMPPEQAAMAFGVKRITLGRSTGGYDKDECPGDELLQVVVEPRDCDEHVIKAPGTLQVFALEITPQGLKVPVSSWEISSEDLRRTWKQGLLSTGYTLQLPWRQFPHCDMVRVVVRLIVAESRVYEADKDVRVHIVPGIPERPAEIVPSRPPVIVPSRPPESSSGPSPPPATLPLDNLPLPRTLPDVPAPVPAEPLLLPSSRSDYRAPRQAVSWTPPTLQGAVRVLRPEPLPD